MLTRLGNKRKISGQLAQHFPQHKMRIELFFGAGGSYFTLPKPQYAVLNDLDDDVTNLYQIILERRADLHEQIRMMPISMGLVKYWKKNQETDPMKKALRFLLLSNFTYLGKGNTLRIGLDNTKQNLINAIEPTFLALENVKILNVDFREVISKVSFSERLMKKENGFVYLDPVYLDTEHYYKVPKWTKDDTADCFEIMKSCGMKCAMSEFDHPFVIEQAERKGLIINEVGQRQNVKNRRMELLITNYELSTQGSLF